MYKKYILVLFTILWCCFIFSFSIQKWDDSVVVSYKVGQVILEKTTSESANRVEKMTADEWSMFNLVIRKFGHFAEFLVLGILMYLTGEHYIRLHKNIISIILCLLVAMIDEFLQMFVDGRSSQVMDVIIDGCGSVIGVLFVYIVGKIWESWIIPCFKCIEIDSFKAD